MGLHFRRPSRHNFCPSAAHRCTSAAKWATLNWEKRVQTSAHPHSNSPSYFHNNIAGPAAIFRPAKTHSIAIYRPFIVNRQNRSSRELLHRHQKNRSLKKPKQLMDVVVRGGRRR
ncbi:hypothetical protein ACP275_08G069000 [Erythranthe tilingii]